jgi:uncharacterized protein (DUF697 family)
METANYSETIQKVMSGGYDSATEEERTQAVRELIQVCSIASGAVAIQPIPFVDSVLITPIQIAMVQAIGRVRGYNLDRKSIVEILGTFGASLLAQNLILAAAKFVPFAGWVMGVAMAYALTYAVGEVSDHYFRTGRGTSADELRAKFKETYDQKRREKQAQHKENQTLKQKLEQLTEAFRSGLLNEEEFARKKEDLLKGF